MPSAYQTDPPHPPQKKLPSKKPALLGLMELPWGYTQRNWGWKAFKRESELQI